ncbi:MAG: TetR/AcrR family transcriptional regulator [Eubacterium sp.]|nr:TetR/AcrR family transcriptional regulator [Eubacterium sp.]
MKSDTYHHGNLKNELIEKGLEYIDRYGVESLSMRKLADSVGVSSAAPYAHFKNKEAFLDSVQNYVTDKFYVALKDAVDNCNDKIKVILELGIRYVKFFYENPLYYHFLFTRKNIKLNEYQPFVFFESIVTDVMNNHVGKNLDKETLRLKTIALWAQVHGLAQLISIEGVVDTDNLEKEIEKILISTVA